MGRIYGSQLVICSDSRERIARYTESHEYGQEITRARVKVRGKTVAGAVFQGAFYPDRSSANGMILPMWEDEEL